VPKNNFFYSKSPYLSSDSSRREIRLLRVLSRKSYVQYIAKKPGWAPIDEATGRPLQLNSYNLLSWWFWHYRTNPNLLLLACELLDKTHLTPVNGPFCALSYCAGKPTDTALILVDGIPFIVQCFRKFRACDVPRVETLEVEKSG